MTYVCPTCSAIGRHTFINCSHPVCPDGRDQPGSYYYPTTQSNPWTAVIAGSVAALIVAVFMLLAVSRAHAHLDHGFNPNPETTKWMESLRRPNYSDSSCCGKGDGYPISSYWQNKGKGTWTAVIGDGSAITYPDGQTREYIATGTEVEVPDEVVNDLKDDLDNPTDTSWIFLRVVNAEPANIYCFIRHPSGN